MGGGCPRNDLWGHARADDARAGSRGNPLGTCTVLGRAFCIGRLLRPAALGFKFVLLDLWQRVVFRLFAEQRRLSSQ